MDQRKCEQKITFSCCIKFTLKGEPCHKIISEKESSMDVTQLIVNQALCTTPFLLPSLLNLLCFLLVVAEKRTNIPTNI